MNNIQFNFIPAILADVTQTSESEQSHSLTTEA